ncbi:DUF924 family protein [Aromatoleum aromaticum]|nr:DUF924 family protein [Aromatoleum aromaticum]
MTTTPGAWTLRRRISPHGRLALILLIDQFPRNIPRARRKLSPSTRSPAVNFPSVPSSHTARRRLCGTDSVRRQPFERTSPRPPPPPDSIRTDLHASRRHQRPGRAP